MSLYKLTRGTVSVIRSDKAGVQEAIARGYAMDGEVIEDDGAYRIVNPSPIFDEDAPMPRPKAVKKPSK